MEEWLGFPLMPDWYTDGKRGSVINSYVLDYLVSEGYLESAQNFVTEAKIQPVFELGPIQERVEVKNAIYGGNIQSAIEQINELYPTLLESDPSLHFALLRVQLVELIRAFMLTSSGDAQPAIEFATSHLASRATTDPKFLHMLEETMTLLICQADSIPASMQHLLDPNLRKDVGDRVNEAIRRCQGERAKSMLFDLIRTRVWAEKKAKDMGLDLPYDKMPFGLDSDRHESEDSVMVENGDD